MTTLCRYVHISIYDEGQHLTQLLKIVEIADAISYLHSEECQIVHGDIRGVCLIVGLIHQVI